MFLFSLTNFVVQYVESPVVGNYEEEAAARSRVRNEIQAKYNLEKVLQKAKFPRETVRNPKKAVNELDIQTGDILNEM